MKPNLFATVSTATKHNAQRNKQSLQAKIFIGVSHFKKTHLKRREVENGMEIPERWKGGGGGGLTEIPSVVPHNTAI